MKNISKFRMIEIGVIAFFGLWLWNLKATEKKQTEKFNMALVQLRGVTKLVIWEQDFQLTNLASKEREYFKLFSTKESVITTINGRMGFHIDLSDSLQTTIQNTPDTVFIKAPLKLTYIDLDLESLQQVKESSIDPTVEVDKATIVQQLNKKALAQYLPQITAQLKSKSLSEQENKLSKLVGRPVRIKITSFPTLSAKTL